MTDTEESLLIEQLLQNSMAAYEQAIRQYQPTMRALAFSIIGEKLADDVVQEAWVSVMRSLGGFQRRSSFKTWLLTITANEAKSRLRREKRSISLESLGEDTMAARFDGNGHWSIPPTQWDLASPEELLDAQQLADCIQLTVSRLPPQQASTLQLREAEGMRLQEICNILEVSESNVRVLLHRARQALYLTIEHFQATGECNPCGKTS